MKVILNESRLVSEFFGITIDESHEQVGIFICGYIYYYETRN